MTKRRDSRKFAVSLDSESNNIQVRDVVKVIDGPHSVCTLSIFFTYNLAYTYIPRIDWHGAVEFSID